MIEFYICKHCKQIVKKVVDSNTDLICCGEVMEKLVPNTVDAAKEKHIPSVDKIGNKLNVTIGEVEHPMILAHHINFVIVETNLGSYKYNFNPTDKPACSFNLRENEEVVHVYAYCNIHGLWMV